MVTRGYDKRACACTLVSHIKNPIRFAREMLLHGNTDLTGPSNSGDSGDPSGSEGGAQGHSVLSGATAEKLAQEWGLEMCEERYYWTRKRWEQHRRGLGKGKGKGRRDMEGAVRGKEGAESDDERDQVGFWGDEEGWDGLEYLPQGTVGCVVLDSEGMMCVATSTGGLTNKLSGRIGDTPTIGAGFWAEEWWDERLEKWATDQWKTVQSPLARWVPDVLRDTLGKCLPALSGYQSSAAAAEFGDEKRSSDGIRAVALSGTGNGDSFLRLAATRTAAAIARFSTHHTLTSAVHQIAGPGGELQRSAGDRWGKTGEGEGGIVGIELVDGVGQIVADFNCGGMFRTWVDGNGAERVMVFNEEYRP
ncbi:MAG: hypothetical protein LQ343_005496 [Gyalolechia ehrenbergii]|nr:MAG: hypothetical protein LQ343_005496 [Gyalolechia ehrenbergii]